MRRGIKTRVLFSIIPFTNQLWYHLPMYLFASIYDLHRFHEYHDALHSDKIKLPGSIIITLDLWFKGIFFIHVFLSVSCFLCRKRTCNDSFFTNYKENNMSKYTSLLLKRKRKRKSYFRQELFHFT